MIPDFQKIILPLLEILGDNKEHELGYITQKICERFKLTEEEKKELLPSGNQEIINNRVGWARTYLKKAKLIESPRRATFKITEQGLKILQSSPEKINVRFLKDNNPEFKEWQTSYKKEEVSSQAIEEVETEKTPEELLDYSFTKLKEELAVDILEKIKSCSSTFFERLVVNLLIAMGYGGSRKEAGETLGKSGDGGIDGIIKEDKLGLDTIYIQAKKWDSTVPITHIRDFAGSLLSKKAKKGIFISTSSYPKSAYEFVQSIEPKIILIDGNALAELMIEHNVGLSTKNSYEVKKIDNDYFDEA